MCLLVKWMGTPKLRSEVAKGAQCWYKPELIRRDGRENKNGEE